MKKDTSILVKNLTKVYKLYKHPSAILKEMLFRKKQHENFKALDNVNFEIKKGEVVGIIGRNGSGKSTLLKIIADTLDKTSGSVQINGKVSAILDLGLGFNPEYTGRENIYNGAMILGMARREINKKINSIIAFSELGDFIDKPFKTYSSGMQARLTFSVATAIDPEILVIDEALAAGDAFFIAKCMDRITKMCRSGATVLFVSHALSTVQRLCNRAIYLEKGKIVKDGPATDVCETYEISIMKEISAKLKQENQPEFAGKNDTQIVWKNGPIDITKVKVLDKTGKEYYSFYQYEPMTVRIFYKADKPLKNLAVWVVINRSDGIVATAFASCIPYQDLGVFKNEGYVDIIWDSIYLNQGNFLLSVGIYPYKKNTQLSTIGVDSYVFHDKLYKIDIKKRGWPMQSVYEQPVKVKHVNLS